PETFYRQIDVVVIPPIWEEPGPIVVADAQAAGKPFLGTRFGGIPEAVARGAVGWLTAPDPDSLAECIRKMLSDPDELTTMTRKFADKNSQRTFPEVVAEYRAIFEELLGREK
ncbi:MAG: glycosyltransferase, partial [Bradyrhizobium sp.]